MTSTLSMNMSNTSSSFHRKEGVDTHFRWASLYKFIVLASVFSSMYLDSVDIFSKEGEIPVSIFETLLFQVLVGAPYMFMDCFIRQYTRKMDGYTLLNPLLRGIQFGIFMQTALLSILSSTHLIDTWRYLGASLTDVPKWNICHSKDKRDCVGLSDLFYKCYYETDSMSLTNFTSTSAHHYYLCQGLSFSFNFRFRGRLTVFFLALSIVSFTFIISRFANWCGDSSSAVAYTIYSITSTLDRTTMTLKAFFGLLIWMVNFFIATVTDETFFRICRLIHWIRVIFTIAVTTMTLITVREVAFDAFGEIMAWDGEIRSVNVIRVVTFAYSMGILGFYDYETLSPYTMTDNAVIFYMVEHNIEGMVRSWIFTAMVLHMKECISLPNPKILSNHYYLFSIIPLSGEFMPIARVYILYIYIQLLLGTTTRLSMMTLSMAKLLQSEFGSVKIMYIVGLICFSGISITVPMTLYVTALPEWFFRGAWKGFDLTTAVVAFLKVFIIVVVYGIRRFSTDIHYWLGFKLTRYWELTWTLLPLTCMIVLILISKDISEISDPRAINFAVSWLVLTFLLIAIINIRTIARYLMNNVLGKAFVASVQYGPQDPEDRKKRRNFDETIELRRCRHDCHILDEEVDCNHLSLMRTISLLSATSDSLEEVFATSGHKQRTSIEVDIENP